MNEFIGTWNVHPIRTTRGNKSPQRLFNLGTAALRRRAEEENVQFTEMNQVSN